MNRVLKCLVALAGLVLITLPAAAAGHIGSSTALPRPFQQGDLFAAEPSGNINWYDADGTFVAELATGLDSVAAIAADGRGRVWAANNGGGVASKLVVIDGVTGDVTAVSPAGSTISPRSIAFDGAGNVYLGDFEIDGKLSKFSSDAQFLGVAIDMESDYIDLARDQCTMYLQRPGLRDSATERWNACTGAFIDVFHDPGSDRETAAGVRLLPDDSVLMKNPDVQRVTQAGVVDKVYSFVECGALGTPQALSPDGSSFYAACGVLGVYEVDVDTGAFIRVLNLATPMTVLGEFRAAAQQGFTGFFEPIDNPPVVNVMRAGKQVQVPFSLGGDHGLDIFAGGYPLVEHGTCDPSAPSDRVEATVIAPRTTLVYDAATDRYVYHFRSRRGWRLTCKTLVLRLKDGTEHRALFQFR
jgi:hypothetical protein